MDAVLKKKLGYACGDIYGGGAFLIFSMLFMNFLVIVEGLSPGLAAAIILVGKVWDAITDPIMGSISDKTRSRFGRRRLYFLVGMAPVFLSFLMMWYGFGVEGETAKFVYYLIAYMFFGTAFTVVMIPYNAMLPEITDDYNERTRFTTMRMAFSAGTAILTAVAPSMLIKAFGSAANGPEQKPGYLVMALVFGAVFALAWLLTFLGTKERRDLPAPEPFSVKRWFSVFRNKTYRIFLVVFVTVQVAIDLLLMLIVFYIDIVVMQYSNYELLMGVLLVSQLLFMFLHNVIAQKWGKNFPLIFGIPVWVAASAAFAFVTSATPFWVLCALAVFIAFGAAAGNLATWSMLSDIYDVDELMTGKRREGVYSGFTTFIRKFSSGIATLLLGFGLQAAGFDQNGYNLMKSGSASFSPEQYASSTVVVVIKWMFVLIPIALLAVSFVFALRYKLNCKRFNNVLKGIEKRKADGENAVFTADELEDFRVLTGRPAGELWQGGEIPPAAAAASHELSPQ